MRQHWRNGIPHLSELLCPWTFKLVVVREGLTAGSFSHGKRTALVKVRVNVIMTILRNMGHNCVSGRIPPLNLKPVNKLIQIGVFRR